MSWFVGSRPALGSLLTAQSLEPASASVSPSLSLCPSPAGALSLCLSKINKHFKKRKQLKISYPSFPLDLCSPSPLLFSKTIVFLPSALKTVVCNASVSRNTFSFSKMHYKYVTNIFLYIFFYYLCFTFNILKILPDIYSY